MYVRVLCPIIASQTSTNALQDHISAVLVLCVLIPKDLTTALVTLDLKETGVFAKVRTVFSSTVM